VKLKLQITILKIVLLAYSQGIVSSRGIEQACARHVQFIAISGDSQPCHAQVANLSHNKRLPRFNHRGNAKVNTQCNLYCMVHNIEKLTKTTIGIEKRQ
jgi:transposase